MQGRTHDAVGRRGAADEALDLTLLSIECLLGLGARDRGRTYGGTAKAETLNHHNKNLAIHLPGDCSACINRSYRGSAKGRAILRLRVKILIHYLFAGFNCYCSG